MNNCS